MDTETQDRPYQTWCFDQAKRENVIVCLPTGAGKTCIAVRLLQHCRPALADPARVAFFVAPTTSLCMQQAGVLSRAGLRTAVLAAGAIYELAPGDDQPNSVGSHVPNPGQRDVLVSGNAHANSRSPAAVSAPAVTPSSGQQPLDVMSGSPQPTRANSRKRTIHIRSHSPSLGSGSDDDEHTDDSGDGSHAGDLGSPVSAVAPQRPGMHLRKQLGSQVQMRKRMEITVAGHDVLVATPGELLHCLTHTLVKLSQTPCLILDEVHHVSGDHPYSLILQHYFLTLAVDQRPRLLGLTATPTQALSDRQALPGGQDTCSLEKLTSARIIGAQDWSAVAAAVPKPTQRLVPYRAVPPTGGVQDTLELLKSAHALLLEAGELRALRLTMRRQQQLATQLARQTLDGKTGLVAATGTNVFMHLARQLEAVRMCIAEMGLWTALVVAQHTILSVTDTSLAMDLDPDLDLSDDSDDETSLSVLLPLEEEQQQFQLQLCMLMEPHRRRLSELERKIAEDLAGDQVADLEKRHCKHGASKGNNKANIKSMRFYAALEEQAAQQAVQTMLTELASAAITDSDEEYEFLKDLGPLLEAHGMSGVLNGCLAPLMMRLLPSQERLEALLRAGSTADTEEEDAEKWFTPKLRTLLDILLKPPQSVDMSPALGRVQGTMVFFSRKVFVIAVHELLQRLPEAAAVGIKADKFLGDTGSASLSRPMAMDLHAQQRVVQDFRHGTTNLLLATHVGSEGLDFGQCSRVVLLDVPGEVTQLMQCKGRARMIDSECLILMPAGSASEERALKRLNEQEQALDQVIREKTTTFISQAAEGGVQPQQEAGAPEGERGHQSQTLTNYVVEQTGARCTAGSAMQLLVQYCLSLPGQDTFTRLQPVYLVTQHGNNVCSCQVVLPNSSQSGGTNIVTFNGPMCRGQGSAQAQAALTAIRALHQSKELDDHLEPSSLALRLGNKGLGTLAQVAEIEILAWMPKVDLPLKLASILNPQAQSSADVQHLATNPDVEGMGQGNAGPPPREAVLDRQPPGSRLNIDQSPPVRPAFSNGQGDRQVVDGREAVQQFGTVQNYLYGWVVQPCAPPSNQVRGLFSVGVYGADGPWPGSPCQPAAAAEPTPQGQSSSTKPGSASILADAIAAADEELGGCNEPGTARLLPFGVLLHRALPAAVLPPYSVWLKGKQHALAAFVPLGPVSLTASELQAVEAGHASLQSLATTKRQTTDLPAAVRNSLPAAGEERQREQRGPEAVSPATCDAVRQPKRAAVGPARGRGRKAGRDNAAAPGARTGIRLDQAGAAAGLVEADVLTQQHASAAGMTRELPTPDQQHRSCLQQASDAWRSMARLPQLRAALRTAGRDVPLDMAAGDADANNSLPTSNSQPASSWYLVTPVALVESHGLGRDSQLLPGAQEAKTRVGRGAAQLNPGGGMPGDTATGGTWPHTAPPRVAGSIDWQLLCRLAAGPSALQDCVDLGQFTVPASLSPGDDHGHVLDARHDSTHGSKHDSINATQSAHQVSERLDKVLRGRMVVPAHSPSVWVPYLAPATTIDRATSSVPTAGLPQPTSSAPAALRKPSGQPGSLQPGATATITIQASSADRLPRKSRSKAEHAAMPACAASSLHAPLHGPSAAQQAQLLLLDDPKLNASEPGPANKATYRAVFARRYPWLKSGHVPGTAPLIVAAWVRASHARRSLTNPPGAQAPKPSKKDQATAAESTGDDCHDTRQLVVPDGFKRHELEVLLPCTLLVHPLHADEWTALLGVPSLMRRLQALASVHEWREVAMPRSSPGIQLPPLRDLLACFTPRCAVEPYSYEGAEMLGDCVLDYQAAVFLFHALPQEAEGVLTECKVRMVANEVLHRHATSQLPLQQYIQCRPYDYLWEWGVGADACQTEGRVRKLGGKVLGDVIEALVGAAFLSLGGAEALGITLTAREQPPLPPGSAQGEAPAPGADSVQWDPQGLAQAVNRSARFCQDLRLLPEGSCDTLAAVHTLIAPTAAAERAVGSRQHEADLKLMEQLKPLLSGYTFRQPALLRESLTHGSYPEGPYNQRLEFLGDAALDMVTTCYLAAVAASKAAHTGTTQQLRAQQILDPDSMTERRGRLVCNRHLSVLCVRCQLHKHMRVGLPALRRMVDKFEASLREMGADQEDEALTQEEVLSPGGQTYGRKKRSSGGRAGGAPKVLADLVEAVLGAILVDSGGNLVEVWRVLWGLVGLADMRDRYIFN